MLGPSLLDPGRSLRKAVANSSSDFIEMPSIISAKLSPCVLSVKRQIICRVLFWTNINGLANLILNFSITSSVGPDLSPQTLSCTLCNAYIMQKTVQICQVVPICRVLVDSNPVFLGVFFLPQSNTSTNFNILEKHLWQGSDIAEDQRETLRLETGGMRETARAAAKSYSGSNILFYLCGHQLVMIFLLGNPSAPCRMESKCSEV